jgi:dimethylamine monooxygenase subunit A
MTLGQKNSAKTNHNYPPHFPFDGPPFRLSMGLLKISAKEWFEIFDLQERAIQMDEKRRLLAEHHNSVFIADPSSLAASTETLKLMHEHLPAVRPDLYSGNRKTIKLKPYSNFKEEIWSINRKTNGIHPLDLAARLVQEDMIIMLPPESTKKKSPRGWWLAAGSVAFPSRWNLRDKFGLTMDMIHAPVPFYKEQIQHTVNNFFNVMPCNEIYARRNWSLYDNSFLRHDGTKQLNKIIQKPITSNNAGDRLWLRVERQTLRKLKQTGAILFTIRIHLRQLKQIVSFDGIPNRLSKALSSLPSEMHTYKQTNFFADSAQEYLNKF